MLLKPTKQRLFNDNIYGFDIETYSQKNKFYMGSIFSDSYQKVFYDKDEMIKEFKTSRFKGSLIAATNMGFDFDALFYKKEDHNFIPIFRGSDRILERGYIYKGRFQNRSPRCKGEKHRCSITFIDTLNYARLSVDKIGKILKLHKLKKPACLGRIPENKKERKELEIYNLRDSELSYRFLLFLYRSFYKLGATPKCTIASTAMSLYKNKYLKNIYWRHRPYQLLDQFKGYYGGRTEAFSRGYFEDYNYGDVNSLYPFVMQNEYPDPNSMRVCRFDDISMIDNYEGVSDVDIYCPDMEYPLLPYKTDDKVLYPIGSFSGWYSHVELRKAQELGYVIKKIRKTYYFKERCRPFYGYVNDLYSLRKKMKKDNDPMQIVVKLLMNSLYGKFGEKFIDKEEYIPMPKTAEELNRYDDFEIIQDSYIRIKKSFTFPKPHCFPIWALYTTAYARLKLYELILRYRPLYVDTDSVITKKNIIDTDELGGLKKEHNIEKGIIVKPKFYAIYDKRWIIKIKGVGRSLYYDDFWKILKGDKVQYQKFMKFKESLRRKMDPNEIITAEKMLDIEDNKREWGMPFDKKDLQYSRPLQLIDGQIKRKNLYKQDPIKIISEVYG